MYYIHIIYAYQAFGINKGTIIFFFVIVTIVLFDLKKKL